MNKAENEVVNKVANKEKYSYGIGAFGKDMVYAFVATYLMIFFTDEVGLSSVFVGGLFFVSRFWDAINDPLMGLIVDNTRTKWGKFRPWILIGTLINAVVLIFLFFNPSRFFEGKMVYVYCAVAYILWGMTYTIMDIPYWSMIPSFTNDPNERDKIAVIPRIFATLGGASVNSFGLILIAALGISSRSEGYFRLGIIIAIVFVISTLITVCNIKEKNVVENKEQIKIKDIKDILLKNDQLMVIICSVVIFQVSQFLYGGFLVYFFTYAIDDSAFYATYVVVGTVVQVIALILFPKMSRIIGRKNNYLVGCGLAIIGFVGMFIVSGFENNILLCGVAVLYNFGVGILNACTTVMISNSVDYGEFKIGKRSESIVFSAQTFIVKFSTAFSGLVTGVGLSIINYVPNEVQSASTILGMKIIMFLIPSILMGVCGVIYFKFYKLNGQFFYDMIEYLEKSRSVNKEDVVNL
ncbi:melibiose:sodium transporter MelB [Clostridium butyricum]|uniref:melibiose:sodium transporter MelB n=1 Tax=Clostridium butyricum TaxID=1492 RepID=UPI003465ED8A